MLLLLLRNLLLLLMGDAEQTVRGMAKVLVAVAAAALGNNARRIIERGNDDFLAPEDNSLLVDDIF